MFHEFKSLVDLQDEQLDTVYENVDKSVVNVEMGVEEIKSARGYQKSGRWILIITMLIICTFWYVLLTGA